MCGHLCYHHSQQSVNPCEARRKSSSEQFSYQSVGSTFESLTPGTVFWAYLRTEQFGKKVPGNNSNSRVKQNLRHDYTEDFVKYI